MNFSRKSVFFLGFNVVLVLLKGLFKYKIKNNVKFKLFKVYVWIKKVRTQSIFRICKNNFIFLKILGQLWITHNLFL